MNHNSLISALALGLLSSFNAVPDLGDATEGPALEQAGGKDSCGGKDGCGGKKDDKKEKKD